MFVCTGKDKYYAEFFGFTHEETSTILAYYGLTLHSGVKKMYDGYAFGKEEMYNPWSIINYFDNEEVRPYWINTNANMMIKKAMQIRDTSFNRGYE